MEIKERPLDCYIGAFSRPLEEGYLESNGFCRGMILFAIPSQGVLFRCRASGSLLDLEFGAYFALLRFINTSLSEQKFKQIKVHSSLPELVFSLVHNGRQVRDDPQRLQLLKKYRAMFDVEVCYVPPQRNQVHLSPVDLPSTPRGQKPPIRPGKGKGKNRFKPIQKGFSL